ncbi:hypothetical protein [Deinococcus depolymerans]|uniref:GNAT family N-acetyltransferase n=1 Tax=Deinococcus depolymerans TaxID=392408 RepID=A0ABN1CRJ0_9DEIO
MQALPVRPNGIWLEQNSDGLYEVSIRQGLELRLLLSLDDVERLSGVLLDWLGASAVTRASWRLQPRCVLQSGAADWPVWLMPAKWGGADERPSLRLSSSLGTTEMDLSDAKVSDLVALCQGIVQHVLVTSVPGLTPALPGLAFMPVQPAHLAQLDAWVNRSSYRATCTSRSEPTLLHLTWGRPASALPARQVADWAVVDDHGVLLGGMRCTHGSSLGWVDVACWYHSPTARPAFTDLVNAALQARLLPFKRIAVTCTGERYAHGLLSMLVLSGAHETLHSTRFPDAAVEVIYCFTNGAPAPAGTGVSES